MSNPGLYNYADDELIDEGFDDELETILGDIIDQDAMSFHEYMNQE